MPGYIHITRLSARTATDNVPLETYQVNYNVSGVTYAIAWTEDELADFLRLKLPLDHIEFEQVMTRLRENGHANIAEVDLPETEASAMGMEMMPDDF